MKVKRCKVKVGYQKKEIPSELTNIKKGGGTVREMDGGREKEVEKEY